MLDYNLALQKEFYMQLCFDFYYGSEDEYREQFCQLVACEELIKRYYSYEEYELGKREYRTYKKILSYHRKLAKLYA